MSDHSGSMTDSATQRRHAARHKMFEPVALRTNGLEMRAHFLDLSFSGARAHADAPPRIGSLVTIEALGLTMTGRVMWVKGKRFGVQFSRSLNQSDIDALIGTLGINSGGATS